MDVKATAGRNPTNIYKKEGINMIPIFNKRNKEFFNGLKYDRRPVTIYKNPNIAKALLRTKRISENTESSIVSARKGNKLVIDQVNQPSTIILNLDCLEDNWRSKVTQKPINLMKKRSQRLKVIRTCTFIN